MPALQFRQGPQSFRDPWHPYRELQHDVAITGQVFAKVGVLPPDIGKARSVDDYWEMPRLKRGIAHCEEVIVECALAAAILRGKISCRRLLIEIDFGQAQ